MANQTQTTQGRSTDEISPYIQNYVGIDTSPGDWIVWWQYAPVIENRWFVNFNRLSWDGFAKEADVLIDRQEAVLSQTWTFEPGLDVQSTKDFEFTSELLEVGGNKYESDPLLFMYYPVFEHFGANAPTVAIISSTVYWGTYFEDILPENANGVVCVVENSFGQAFTYQINGKEATFLGMSDLHDPEFDGMEISADYSSFSQSGLSAVASEYRGVPVDDQHISYRIRVYPSTEFKSDYITPSPLIYTSVMVTIFLLTAGIFITYDCFVERRQKLVMTTAEKSSAVVSSLFPEAVRDRLLATTTPKPEQKQNQLAHMSGADPSDWETDRSKGAPIADFFPETTLMFAGL